MGKCVVSTTLGRVVNYDCKVLDKIDQLRCSIVTDGSYISVIPGGGI